MLTPQAASLISSGLQLTPEIFRLIQGIKQTREGKRIAAGLQDPVYDIPDSAEESLAAARAMTASRYISGQTNLQNQLDQNTANVTSDIMRSAQSSGDILGALTAVNANNQAGQNQIAFQAAQDYRSRMSDFRGALDMMAGFEDKKWTNDILNKFLRDSAAASALTNAGMHNTYGSIKGMANAGSSLVNSLATKQGGGDNDSDVLSNSNTDLNRVGNTKYDPSRVPYWEYDNISFPQFFQSGFIGLPQ
jgi:hypothetical protein